MPSIESFVSWGAATLTFLRRSGGTMSGDIAMGSNKVTGLASGSADTDAPTVLQAGFGTRLLHVREEQTSGTNGGTFTSGARRTRVQNTVVTNEITGASLSGNQITLPAGTYHIEGSAPAYDVSAHQTWLYNTTDAADAVIGTAEWASATVAGAQTRSFLSGRFTIAAQKVFEIQHQCAVTSGGTTGLGVASGFGTEVYTDAKIWKIG